MERHYVRVSGDDLTFSASHFITFDAQNCEPLHGHNYRVKADVHGPLGDEHYVVDFIAVRDTLRAILDELDHGVLLPTEHPAIRLQAGGREVEVAFGERRWVFPRSDCKLRPLANTTAEAVARWIAGRLIEGLRAAGVGPTAVRIELAEGAGFSAICELDDLAPGGFSSD